MGFLAAWHNKSVLVTGGTGFIGRHVLAIGQAADIDLANLSLNSTTTAGVRHYQSDIGDIGRLETLLQKLRPAAILHLAAAGVSYESGSFSASLETNTLKLESLLKLASSLNPVPQVVIAGSGFEYGPGTGSHAESDPLEPLTPYGISKAAATLVARYYARIMPITVLRLFSIYGPGERSPRLGPYIIECAMRGEPVELTQCEQLRDYTCVTDVAESFWRALANPHRAGKLRVINVASGHALSLRIFVETLADQLKLQGIEADLHFGVKPYRYDEPMNYLADVSLMKSAFCWQPSTSLQAGLNSMLAQTLADDSINDLPTVS